MYLILEALGHLDPLAALMRREVGRIDIVPGHPGDQPCPQRRTKGGEDEALVALLGDVVEEEVAEQVARERGDAAALVSGGLA